MEKSPALAPGMHVDAQHHKGLGGSSKDTDPHPHHHVQEYLHMKNVKRGLERLDRRPATGMLGNPKKEGHGGKYTWAGPDEEDRDYVEPLPAAIDPKDPNYVDEQEETAAAAVLEPQPVIGTVEVAKVGPQGVARIEIDDNVPVESDDKTPALTNQ